MSDVTEKESSRFYGLDNLKFILIFCVVLGHTIEISDVNGDFELLYRVIYSFHMPVFIFIAGYFAKFSKKKIILKFLFTYIVFQTLYKVFNYYIIQINPGTEIDIELVYPFWILWYLAVLLFLYLLIPFVDFEGKSERSIFFLGCVVLSLLSGYENYIGQYLALSRLFSFLPFFVLGFYWRKTENEAGKKALFPKMKPFWLKTWITVAAVVSVCFIMLESEVNSQALWMQKSYEYGDYNAWIKLVILAIAIVWIALFFIVILPLINRKIAIISTLGRNCFPIYLFHGFIVLLIKKYSVLSAGNIRLPLSTLIVTLLILVLCGNPITAKVFDWVFSGNWIEWLWNKLPSKERKSER